MSLASAATVSRFQPSLSLTPPIEGDHVGVDVNAQPRQFDAVRVDAGEADAEKGGLRSDAALRVVLVDRPEPELLRLGHPVGATGTAVVTERAVRQPGQHHLLISDPANTPGPRFKAVSACLLGFEWARLDSNQGPTDYESAALTS